MGPSPPPSPYPCLPTAVQALNALLPSQLLGAANGGLLVKQEAVLPAAPAPQPVAVAAAVAAAEPAAAPVAAAAAPDVTLAPAAPEQPEAAPQAAQQPQEAAAAPQQEQVPAPVAQEMQPPVHDAQPPAAPPAAEQPATAPGAAEPPAGETRQLRDPSLQPISGTIGHRRGRGGPGGPAPLDAEPSRPKRTVRRPARRFDDDFEAPEPDSDEVGAGCSGCTCDRGAARAEGPATSCGPAACSWAAAAWWSHLCPLRRRMLGLFVRLCFLTCSSPCLARCRTMCPASMTTHPRHSGHQRHTAPEPPPPLRSAPPPRRL